MLSSRAANRNTRSKGRKDQVVVLCCSALQQIAARPTRGDARVLTFLPSCCFLALLELLEPVKDDVNLSPIGFRIGSQ